MITAGAIGLLVVGLSSLPAQAQGRFTASARRHAHERAATTVRVQVAATATAASGTPAVSARVTVRVWASATGRASASASATAKRSGSTRTKARAAARAAALRLAAQRARRAAVAVARARALRAARAAGALQARAAAQREAAGQARTLALSARPSPAADACASLPKAGGGSWRCTFDEEFNGTALDRSKWSPETSAMTGIATNGACFMDSPDNYSVGGGVLNLTVRKLAAPISCPEPNDPSFTTSYTGGQIGTLGHFAQTYGRFAVRARFPASVISGLQSSLWMWPTQSPTGEIDIAEWYSQFPDRVIPYLHYSYLPGTVKATSLSPVTGTNVVTNTNFLVSDVNAFHEYAVEWSATTLTITVDGRTVLVDHLAPNGPSPFNQPFFMVLSGCLGGTTNSVTPSTPLPATTQVDWVRAWK